MKCSLGISNFLKEISRLSHSIVFLYFFALITGIQIYILNSNAEEAERFYEDLQDLLELTSKTDFLFIIRDWNAKVGGQKIPGVMGKFGLGV